MTKIVRAPRSKVTEYFGDPEKYRIVHERYWKSFRILAQEHNVAYVDEVWEIAGRRAVFTHKITLNLPNRIDMEIVKGDGKGSRETITFEEVAEHTKVTYAADYRLPGAVGSFLGWLAAKQMKMVLEDMAERDKHFVEGTL